MSNDLLDIDTVRTLVRKNSMGYKRVELRDHDIEPTCVATFKYPEVPTQREILQGVRIMTRSMRDYDKQYSYLDINDIDVDEVDNLYVYTYNFWAGYRQRQSDMAIFSRLMGRPQKKKL